jgi:hypothetical protein
MLKKQSTTVRELTAIELDLVSGGDCTCPGCCTGAGGTSGGNEIFVNCEGTLVFIIGPYTVPIRD